MAQIRVLHGLMSRLNIIKIMTNRMLECALDHMQWLTEQEVFSPADVDNE
jgi:hypothetical protein